MDIVGAKEMDMLNQFHVLMISEAKNIGLCISVQDTYTHNLWNCILDPVSSIKRRHADSVLPFPALQQGDRTSKMVSGKLGVPIQRRMAWKCPPVSLQLHEIQ